MNIEELKLILQTIEKIGQAGQWAFGWYMLFQVIPPVLLLVFGLTTILTAKKIIFYCVKETVGMGEISRILEIIDWVYHKDSWSRLIGIVAKNKEFIKYGKG